MEYIHIIIDFFANGKSQMKVYLFFVFLIIILFINFFNKIKIENPKKDSNKIKKIMIALMVILYSLNLGSFVYFYKSNNIPFFSSIYLYNNNEVSSTNILHNHTLKAPIGFLIDKLNFNPVQEYVDTGYAYTSFFPEVFLYTTIVLVFIFILFLFLYLSRQKQTFLQTIIFSIVSFSVVKNVFDGGVFHTEAIIAIPAFLILLKNNSEYKRKEQNFNLFIFLIYIYLGIFMAFTVSEYLSSSRYVFLERFITKFTFFFALVTLYYKNQIKSKWVHLACLPIIIIIIFQYTILIQKKYLNNITFLDNSQKIVAYTKNPPSNIFEIESKIDFNETAVIIAKVKKNIKNIDIIKELGIKDEFSIYNIVDITCTFSNPHKLSFITKLNNQEIKIDSNLIKIYRGDDSLLTETSSCLYITPSILKEIFKENGINKIILIQNGKSDL